MAFTALSPKSEEIAGLVTSCMLHYQERMFASDDDEPKDDISRMEKLSKKIMNYELNNKNQNTSLPSLLEETQEQRHVHKQNNDKSHTLELFRKYLHEKAQHARRLAKIEEIEVASAKFQNKPCRSLLPRPRDANLYSRPTLLEKGLLPGIRRSSPVSNAASARGQLTIFYSGTVNVYNNVPIDKAQAIMLLAGESSMSDPVSPSTPTSTDSAEHTGFQTATTMQQELPTARKLSLRRFLEKRRYRIARSPPYFIGNLKQRTERSAIYHS